LKLKDIVKQDILSFVHNYVHINLPYIFNKYFGHRYSLYDILSGYKPLRFKYTIHKTSIGANTVKVKAPKLYDKEASDIDLNLNLKTFRYKIDTKILNSPDN